MVSDHRAWSLKKRRKESQCEYCVSRCLQTRQKRFAVLA